MKLQTGDKAPDFTTEAYLEGSGTAKWTLSEQVKNGPVLLVFYPGDFTSVCTKQLCDYRDNWEQLKSFKAQVVGISTDDKESHAKFAAANKLPFPLLDDSSKEICRKLGMLSLIGMASRGFMLIGKDMRVRYVFREVLPFFKRSAGEVADILRSHQ
jgi:peroxiredoxin